MELTFFELAGSEWDFEDTSKLLFLLSILKFQGLIDGALWSVLHKRG
jgi:hypothetical protein